MKIRVLDDTSGDKDDDTVTIKHLNIVTVMISGLVNLSNHYFWPMNGLR